MGGESQQPMIRILKMNVLLCIVFWYLWYSGTFVDMY